MLHSQFKARLGHMRFCLKERRKGGRAAEREEGRRRKEEGKRKRVRRMEGKKKNYFKKSLENLARPCLPVKNFKQVWRCWKDGSVLNILNDPTILQRT